MYIMESDKPIIDFTLKFNELNFTEEELTEFFNREDVKEEIEQIVSVTKRAKSLTKIALA